MSDLTLGHDDDVASATSSILVVLYYNYNIMGPILITKAPLVAYLNTSFTTPRNIAVVSVLGLQPAADAAHP